jgi:hypothetical protein
MEFTINKGMAIPKKRWLISPHTIGIIILHKEIQRHQVAIYNDTEGFLPRLYDWFINRCI